MEARGQIVCFFVTAAGIRRAIARRAGMRIAGSARRMFFVFRWDGYVRMVTYVRGVFLVWKFISYQYHTVIMLSGDNLSCRTYFICFDCFLTAPVAASVRCFLTPARAKGVGEGTERQVGTCLPFEQANVASRAPWHKPWSRQSLQTRTKGSF